MFSQELLPKTKKTNVLKWPFKVRLLENKTISTQFHIYLVKTLLFCVK
jgi:hypothetical protein